MSNIIDNYENTVINLLKDKSFFAKLIMSMKKDFNFKPHTAAVSVSSQGITLHLNKAFFNGLTPSEREGIMIHEVLHLVHGHPLRFKKYNPLDHGMANVACDIAINQFIPNLPKTIKVAMKNGEVKEGSPVTLELLRKQIPHAKEKMHAEYYFDLLKEEQQKNGGRDGEGEFYIVDNHDEWENSDLTEEQQERYVKGHVKAILDSCSPGEKACLDQSLIDELYKSDVNWKQRLRQFFANSEETFTESSRKKRNRRYGIQQPGFKNEPKLKLGICVDTSGSISDEELKLFFGEIDRIYNDKMVLWIVEADAKVQNVYEYKPKMKINAKGRGGTFYQSAIDKITELQVDAGLYFGDFDSSDVPKKPRFPFLWVGVRNSSPPADFGKVIRIDK